MTERDLIRAHYGKIAAADFPHAVAPDDEEARLKAVSVRGCHGNSTNLLFFSVEVEDGIIRRIRYDCQYCDVIMYVTAELICRLAGGRPVSALSQIREDDICRDLGGPSKKVVRQATTSLTLVQEGLQEGLQEG